MTETVLRDLVVWVQQCRGAGRESFSLLYTNVTYQVKKISPLSIEANTFKFLSKPSPSLLLSSLNIYSGELSTRINPAAQDL